MNAMTNNKQVQNLLNVALELIKAGTSTIETAFVDAIELENKHLVEMIIVIDSPDTSKKANYFSKAAMYNEVLNEITHKVYSAVKGR